MVKKIKAYAKRNQRHADFNLHMCFYGNPGTGKTEVARILSRILYGAGVLDEANRLQMIVHIHADEIAMLRGTEPLPRYSLTPLKTGVFR